MKPRAPQTRPTVNRTVLPQRFDAESPSPENGTSRAAEKIHPATQPQATLLTVREVAGLLQLPISWVYARTRRRSRDRLPGFRLGKYWRFRTSDVMVWLEQRRVEGSRTCPS